MKKCLIRAVVFLAAWTASEKHIINVDEYFSFS
jgi:hypothetical protein